MAEQRIQKVLADQGICSRREAERLIAAGKVKVNGHPVTLGDKMDPDYDKVMIDGQTQRIVRKRQYTYIMLHKPRGYLTTRSDDRGRNFVMDFFFFTMEWTPADSSPDLSYSLLALFV